MKNQGCKMKLKLLIPHILHAKWKIEDKSIKEFIKRYGYWTWEQSIPTLKVYMNDENIMGEQDSFFIQLKEGEVECVFFIPNDNKVYRTEYGRCIGENIFLPMMSSNHIIHSKNNYYSSFRLPDSFLNLIDHTETIQSLNFS